MFQGCRSLWSGLGATVAPDNCSHHPANADLSMDEKPLDLM
jgi:hypothetical protein